MQHTEDPRSLLVQVLADTVLQHSHINDAIGLGYADQIDESFIETLYRASPLHDIGRAVIPDMILLKPGQLTTSEFAVMKHHTVAGAEALTKAVDQTEGDEFVTMATEVVRHHHERFDGGGYPDNLKGTAIPLSARIVGLADVYDALTSARVYKLDFEPAVAKDMIEKQKGVHFDPAIVEAFCGRFEDIVQTCTQTT